MLFPHYYYMQLSLCPLSLVFVLSIFSFPGTFSGISGSFLSWPDQPAECLLLKRVFSSKLRPATTISKTSYAGVFLFVCFFSTVSSSGYS